MDTEKILEKVEKLIDMYKQGKLGGEIMPEDANPNLEKASLENYLYFTLPMALNYQRNSYKLWESALQTYQDSETSFVFEPRKCINKKFEDVQVALTKYKVALQKQKQTEIWLKHRKYKNIDHLTVAPDTHVCKATLKLGLISNEEFNSSNVQLIVIKRWQEILANTKYNPIDVHTPLWLWSRNGFMEI